MITTESQLEQNVELGMRELEKNPGRFQFVKTLELGRITDPLGRRAFYAIVEPTARLDWHSQLQLEMALTRELNRLVPAAPVFMSLAGPSHAQR